MTRTSKREAVSALDIDLMNRLGLLRVLMKCYKIYYSDLEPEDYEAEAFGMARLGIDLMRAKAHREWGALNRRGKTLRMNMRGLRSFALRFARYSLDAR